jgi:hypothetical protein
MSRKRNKMKNGVGGGEAKEKEMKTAEKSK